MIKGSKGKQRNFNIHGETEKRHSWYWSVLIKNYGNVETAKQAVSNSRKMVDPIYNLELLQHKWTKK